MKDNNGTDINIGDLVAYNRSGDVVKGVVEKFGRPLSIGWQVAYGGRPTNLTYTYVRNSKDRKLSKVKRPQSLMVIARKVTTNQIGCPIWGSVI